MIAQMYNCARIKLECSVQAVVLLGLINKTISQIIILHRKFDGVWKTESILLFAANMFRCHDSGS